jgi:hypothetical protein
MYREQYRTPETLLQYFAHRAAYLSTLSTSYSNTSFKGGCSANVGWYHCNKFICAHPPVEMASWHSYIAPSNRPLRHNTVTSLECLEWSGGEATEQ